MGVQSNMVQQQDKRTCRGSANEKWPPQKQWVTCCNGEFIRQESVVWISEEHKGVVLLGTTDGYTYTAHPEEVSLIKGFMMVPMYDNDIAIVSDESDMGSCDSDTNETEEWCSDTDSECDTDSESGSSWCDPVVALNNELLKVYFRTNHILAVYMQCADPDEDGDNSYGIVLPDGGVRNVFCHLPMEEMYHQIELDVNQTPQFFRPTPVQYENKLLDRGEPRYVVCFRPNRVTCYSNIKMVSESEAFVDVMLDNGHSIPNVWMNGDSWRHLHDIVKSPLERKYN
jgi:hypothetical protein